MNIFQNKVLKQDFVLSSMDMMWNVCNYPQVDEHRNIEDQRQSRDRNNVVGEILPPGSCKDVNTIL